MDTPRKPLGPLVEYEVEPNYGGWTLADYVNEKLKRPLPAAVLDRLLRGPALVHGEPEPLLPETRVWPGLKFGLHKRARGDEGMVPEIPVVYVDDALLVVDKPAGLALHPTARYHDSTLTVALEKAWRAPDGSKPDPAHRLDRETSGLVACGRAPQYTKVLKAHFAARAVEKTYIALCEGAAPSDTFQIDLPLKLGSGRIKVKMAVTSEGAPSVTACTVLARYRDGAGRPLTLLRCEPRTGRQHQLRVHLSAVGLPLVGDKLYGPSEEIFLRLAESGAGPAAPGTFDALITAEERVALRLPRQALHAATLALPHPVSGERAEFRADLPADLQALLATLEKL